MKRPPAKTAAALDPRYRLGTWSGHPNYECSACPFKTLNRVEFEQHWRARHAPAAPRPSSLVDSAGTPLIMQSSDNEET